MPHPPVPVVPSGPADGVGAGGDGGPGGGFGGAAGGHGIETGEALDAPYVDVDVDTKSLEPNLENRCGRHPTIENYLCQVVRPNKSI